MGWLSRRRDEKRRGDFVFKAGVYGASFATSLTGDEVLECAAASSRVEAVERGDDTITVCWLSKNGKPTTQTMTVRVEQAGEARTIAVISVSEPGITDGAMNVTGLGPVSQLMARVAAKDSTWRGIDLPKLG